MPRGCNRHIKRDTPEDGVRKREREKKREPERKVTASKLAEMKETGYIVEDNNHNNLVKRYKDIWR